MRANSIRYKVLRELVDNLNIGIGDQLKTETIIAAYGPMRRDAGSIKNIVWARADVYEVVINPLMREGFLTRLEPGWYAIDKLPPEPTNNNTKRR